MTIHVWRGPLTINDHLLTYPFVWGGVVVAGIVSCSIMSDSFATPWTAACQASVSLTISQSLPKIMSIELAMPSNSLIFCHPLLLTSIFPSIRVISNESSLHISWPKYWSFSFSISPSNEYSGLISFRIEWFDFLAVKGTLRIFPSATIWKH